MSTVSEPENNQIVPASTAGVLPFSQRHPILRQAWDDGLRLSWQQVGVPTVSAAASLLVSLYRDYVASRLDLSLGLKNLAWSLLIGTVLYVAIAVFRAPFVVIGNLQKELLEIRRGLAESKPHSQLPELRLKIKEAFINPEADHTAHCFIRISLINLSDTPCRIPTDYSLIIITKGRGYSRTTLLSLGEYQLEHYKWTVEYDDNGEQYPTTKNLYTELLEPAIVSEKGTLAARGDSIEGWIGMALHYLPAWEHDKEHIGDRQELLFDDEHNAIDCEYVPEYQYTPHVRTVDSLTVEVTDIYGNKWKDKTLSFNLDGKRVTRRKLERAASESP